MSCARASGAAGWANAGGTPRQASGAQTASALNTCETTVAICTEGRGTRTTPLQFSLTAVSCPMSLIATVPSLLRNSDLLGAHLHMHSIEAAQESYERVRVIDGEHTADLQVA